MKRWINILLVILGALTVIPAIHAMTSGQVIPHKTKKFVFESGHFNVVGELRIPSADGKYPLVIMVHGDGPAYRH